MALKFVTELPQDEIAPRSKHAENAVELAENPGVWAQIGQYSKRASATSMVSDIKKNKKGNAYDPKLFEAEARSENIDQDDEAHYVFARYVGPVVEAEDTDADADQDEASAPAFSG